MCLLFFFRTGGGVGEGRQRFEVPSSQRIAKRDSATSSGRQRASDPQTRSQHAMPMLMNTDRVSIKQASKRT